MPGLKLEFASGFSVALGPVNVSNLQLARTSSDGPSL